MAAITFYNNEKKPNLVGFLAYQIRQSWDLGWGKKDINFNYIQDSWNGMEFTGIRITGIQKKEFLKKLEL